jgi:hypothetical protein
MKHTPIVRRRRFKQTLSLGERLQLFATKAREQAQSSATGEQKETLLKKARQADNVAEIDSFLCPQGPPGRSRPDRGRP